MIKKKLILFFLFLVYYIFPDSKISFYGEYQSIFDLQHAKTYKFNDFGEFGWGWNNYANLRMKADVNDNLSFDMAFNFNTFSGNYSDSYQLYFKAFSQSIYQTLNTTGPTTYNSFLSIPFYYKDSYVGNIELERMYFNTGNDYFNIQAGLFRMNNGYGYTFKPMDFINPLNPINPAIRPEGRLGILTTFYPMPLWEVETFILAPDNPIEEKGWGFKLGADTKVNFKKFHMEFLYTLFLPEIEYLGNQSDLNLPNYVNNNFSHLIGFGFKADVEVGLNFEITYDIDQGQIKNQSFYGNAFYFYRGLQATLGIDYTIPIEHTDSKFYLLLEYFFNGPGNIDWWDKNLDGLYTTNIWKNNNPLNRQQYLNLDFKPQIFERHDYISGLVTYTLNTYVSFTGTYLFGIDDQSSLLGWNIEIEPFQSFTIDINGLYPLDWEIINSTWNAGEFGSINLGYYQDYRITITLKF